MGSNLVLQGGTWVLQQLQALTSSAQALSPSYWGSGIDGDLTVVGTYTQTYSLNLSSLTIPSGTIFKPNGYPTFVSGTTTIDAGGSFNDDGNNAAGTTAGAALAQRNPLDARSGAGGNGRTNLSAIGLVGGAPSASRTSRNSVGALGKGGSGGSAPAFGIQSGGQTAGSQIFQFQNFSCFPIAATAGGYTGGGGGAGGAASYDTVNAVTSGAGGSGAGVLWLASKFIVNNGIISCNGGNASNATSAGGTSAGGGGGGGMGGFAIVFTTTPSASCGTITANGGTKGLGAGTGGGDGTDGEVGNAIIVSFS